ncbi:helix-turn-helix domain-containing protein [Desulfoluna butyratoxydans]|uniref:Cro/c1-type helix-turn-helix domain n=1 Tax=Desulfoluna butyratoxydans TaxID=231438 RepID=A0A4V6IM53_9BACT|nr:helix-turn-helix transcriptional regulator [Desulfoluna butyratoxydans]VFQ47388.1 cro/c1-type helix-turn-helix domain [Desulfoluna butyratoxydans]
MSRPTFDDFKKRALKNPEVKEAYDELAPEFELRRKLIEMRLAAGLTQEEIAKRMGTKKSNISRLESASGKHSPKLSTLKSYAEAAGYTLDLQFRPTP